MERDAVSGTADPAGGEDPGRAPSGDLASASEPVLVPIAALLPADSPRLSGQDTSHILRLAETDEPLPPILVHRATMRIIDGMHRMRAAMLRNQDHIEAVFFEGGEDEAFLRAVQENAGHGLPLSLADRRAAAIRILRSHPHLADRVISRHAGLSAQTIGTLRRSTVPDARSNTRVGSDGRRRSVDGSVGRRLAAEAIAARPDAPLREIAKAAGIAVSTAHDVRMRLLRGEDPVPRRAVSPDARPSVTSARADCSPETDSPSFPSAGRRHGRADLRDRETLLRRLMKDPSLRHTDLGRELLRLLNSRTITPEEWTALLDAVPVHCRNVVAQVARQCARSWLQFADEIERRRPAAG